MTVIHKCCDPRDAQQHFAVSGKDIYVCNLNVIRYNDHGHPVTIGRLDADLRSMIAAARAA